MTMLPPLRSHREIQKAHDTLTALLLGDPDILRRIVDEDKVDLLVASVDVLCWCLNHNHNCKFAVNLQDVEELMREEGLEMRELPQEPCQ